MADNVAITPGIGATIRADDIGGALHQIVKPAYGDDGSATMVSAANPLPVTGAAVDPTDGATATATVSSATTLVSFDAAKSRSVSVQVTAAGTTCTLVYEASNDNSTWRPVAGYDPGAPGTGFVTSTTAAGRWVFPLHDRYFRVRCSVYGSGSPAIAYTLKSTPLALPDVAAGATVRHLVSAASTNATNVKAAPGRLLGVSLLNTNAAIRYLKFHNTAGTPTAGSGVAMTIGVPANGGRVDLTYPAGGVVFSTGIAFTAVTGAADADTTGVGSNDLVGDILYV